MPKEKLSIEGFPYRMWRKRLGIQTKVKGIKSMKNLLISLKDFMIDI
jgi:hypothetical protein